MIPGYRVRFSGVEFFVGVSCEADLSDDCSAYPYREDYRGRHVYVRYIQTSDRKFRTAEGAEIGDRWDQATKMIGSNPIIYSVSDSCVRLPSGWHACIDLMSTSRVFDPSARRLLPKNSAKIDFFYQRNNE